ncbi:helix-turn-helix transcriptional regulator [Chitinophaga filiformis]|uniref:Helix-turn-helix transcriptional regulator n=1 Tax=Chitinophaga filiformis TaxID=104663 RepID=A0ABY4I8V8_CHIFI|nr:helix-turn-helix domain-containing protein [Chitinophaga filiformis]UPK71684.1 helix-turn-helix transcriptional regulator [Chitinophaga filiformis]
MQADISTLYESQLCTVHNFLCRCTECTVSKKESQETFSIAYVRRGNFEFKVFRNDLDAHHGLFLVCKPGYEHRVGHAHDLPDECTIFSLPAENLDSFRSQTSEFSWFFNNPDIQSVLIKATPQTEHLHHIIFRELAKPRHDTLFIEQLVTNLLLMVVSTGDPQQMLPVLNYKQKKFYLPVIESVKYYINDRFTDDISLTDLAGVSHLSPFHFSRLFKQLTGVTPYTYLLKVRLAQATLLIRNTHLPITDIAFSCGFNSLEHFSASYRNIYGKAPSQLRL